MYRIYVKMLSNTDDDIHIHIIQTNSNAPFGYKAFIWENVRDRDGVLLATLMATHERLGADSKFAVLEQSLEDLLPMIMKEFKRKDTYTTTQIHAMEK
jgi:hypothetical protein